MSTIEGTAVEVLPAVRERSSLAVADELSINEIVSQVEKIQQAMKVVMKDGQHYGVIPGTIKPSLLKPGAEKLGLMFRLAPSYTTVDRHFEEGHLDVYVECRLTHITSGEVWADGVGSCSTRESKYAYRNSARVCPSCGKETIIKGKAEYGGGWLCWKKNGGCNAKFPDGDQGIESQAVGKVANENLADTYNTVLKMAKKRALIDATISATGASDIFTQDVEDHASAAVAEESPFRGPDPAVVGTPFDGDAYEATPAQSQFVAPTDTANPLLASGPQQKNIRRLVAKIAKDPELRWDESDLWAQMEVRFGTGKVAELSKADASTLIDSLVKLAGEEKS